MNKQERERLQGILDKLTEMRDEIGEMSTDAQTKVDNMQEHFEGTERYEQLENQAYELTQAEEDFESIISTLEGILAGD